MITREQVATHAAPAAAGPYSQAMRAGDLVFTAGQLGLDPSTGEFSAEDAAGQAERALANLAAILDAAGSGLDRLVKTTVYLADLGDFAGMNEVYARHVGDVPPARATIEVSALPSGAKVEIEAVATL